MQNRSVTFPWPEVLAGDIRGVPEAELVGLCGPPDEVEGDLRIYRFGRRIRDGTTGDPRAAVVQIWMTGGAVDHAALHLAFPDGPAWDEVLW